MPAPVIFDSPTIDLRPWVDDVIDTLGHDPRSRYVETFWLSVLGPSTVWLVRRIASGFDHEPEGYQLDLDITALSLGLGAGRGRNSAFVRAIARLCKFEVARPIDTTTLAVRRALPPLTLGQVRRLPPALQAEHQRWTESALTPRRKDDRARELALTMAEFGDGQDIIEHQLARWKFTPSISREAATWATEVAKLRS